MKQQIQGQELEGVLEVVVYLTCLLQGAATLALGRREWELFLVWSQRFLSEESYAAIPFSALISGSCSEEIW